MDIQPLLLEAFDFRPIKP